MNATVPRALAASVLGLLACLPAGCSFGDGLEFRESFELPAVPVAALDALAVDLHNGSVELVGVDDGRPVRIEGLCTVWADSAAEAALAFDHLIPTAEPDGDTLKVSARWDEHRPDSYRFRYRIEMPRRLVAKVRTHDGAVTAAGLGSLEANSRNGAVTVTDHRGDLTVHTHDGAVTAAGHFPRVELETHNGAVSLAGLVGVCTVTTRNGAVAADLRDSPTPLGRLESRNGDVTLTLAADAQVMVHADSDGGRVQGVKDRDRHGTSEWRLGTPTEGELLSLATRSGDVEVRIDGALPAATPAADGEVRRFLGTVRSDLAKLKAQAQDDWRDGRRRLKRDLERKRDEFRRAADDLGEHAERETERLVGQADREIRSLIEQAARDADR